MPNMITGKSLHGSVGVKNKLFVFDYEFSEVFDSTSGKFVALKKKPSHFKFGKVSFKYCMLQTFVAGNKLVTLGSYSSIALCYDVEKNEWSEEPFEATKNMDVFSCTLLPKMKF